MSVVYWLHLPEHINILSEGYIGVTSQNPQKRFYHHLYEAKNGIHRNTRLMNVLNKYHDQIMLSVLMEGSEEYCYQIEKRLRPSVKIGWNLSIGGYDSGFKKGVIHAPKSITERERAREFFLFDNPMHDPIAKIKQAESRARDWSIVHPDGRKEIIHNLAKFCRIHNLKQSTVITATRRGHKVKGFVVERQI